MKSRRIPFLPSAATQESISTTSPLHNHHPHEIVSKIYTQSFVPYEVLQMMHWELSTYNNNKYIEQWLTRQGNGPLQHACVWRPRSSGGASWHAWCPCHLPQTLTIPHGLMPFPGAINFIIKMQFLGKRQLECKDFQSCINLSSPHTKAIME